MIRIISREGRGTYSDKVDNTVEPHAGVMSDEKGDEQRQFKTFFSCPIFVTCRKMEIERTTTQRGEGDKPQEGVGVIQVQKWGLEGVHRPICGGPLQAATSKARQLRLLGGACILCHKVLTNHSANDVGEQRGL